VRSPPAMQRRVWSPCTSASFEPHILHDTAWGARGRP
jgi:hypothetical protein